MTNIWRTLTIDISHPVNSRVVDTLSHIDTCFKSMGKNYFLGGAQARDLILFHVFGIPTTRATSDVDIGVCVEDWETFKTLKRQYAYVLDGTWHRRSAYIQWARTMLLSSEIYCF